MCVLFDISGGWWGVPVYKVCLEQGVLQVNKSLFEKGGKDEAHFLSSVAAHAASDFGLTAHRKYSGMLC